MAEREVVITGLGIVSPIGVGREAVWEAIVARRSGVRTLPQLAAAGWLAPFGGDVADFDPKELIQPRKSIKVMSREIQLASAAAELAWQDAGLAEATIDPERFGVVGAAGVMYCDLEELRIPFVEWIKQEDFDIHRWSRQAMGELYPLWMLKYLPNMPACHIGIRYDARGPNNTIAEGDVSSLLALGEAADVIRRDQADVMIVGGTGSRINLIGPDVAPRRPAGVQRQSGPGRRSAGRSMPSGAAWCTAKGRRRSCSKAANMPSGAACRPLARVAGRGHAVPSRRPIAQQPTGDAIRRAIRAALGGGRHRAERHRPRQRARQLSTREDDPIEARAIRDTLGDVPVTAPKSYFGNLGQGSGMVELAVSLMATRARRGAADAQLRNARSGVPGERGDGDCRRPSKPAFVKLSHNATGQAAAVVITAD